ncbi:MULTISPECIES: transaldolase family protein [unclassified Streptomyces]|uniref:transaldolase family protein n=1 Tax=unclassified Streptomyces TaxID=2593676 RepID=UPI000DAE97AD|nr:MULTISPECIES: transaldolase family protein [unclassified Streptomyces]PZT74828.1 hypothetical protein DNK55_22525 [Streptomyces sp. AC1-42T]PZT82187.1 hypothetical protein DNK56_08920 [Streptomyces sp. AC1-42W]
MVSRAAAALLKQLTAEGVSPWIVFSRPEQIEDEPLDDLLDGHFHGAVLPAGSTEAQVRRVCDALLPLFTDSEGMAGQVSVPMARRLAEDAESQYAGARMLHSAVHRSNLMVRIPMTAEGLKAFADCLADGIGVDAAAVFSTERYDEVLDAYYDGMERALVAGRHLAHIPVETTCPVGMLDRAVETRLDQLGIVADHEARGTAGLAMARRMFRLREGRLAQEWWRVLRAAGAVPPRLLWTGGDRRSVSDLVGWHTAHALSLETLEEAADGPGLRGDTLMNSDTEGRRTLQSLVRLGVPVNEVTDALEAAGHSHLQRD